MTNRNIEKFKKVLKIKDAVLGSYFSDKLPLGSRRYRDTACTALARSFLKGCPVSFDAKRHRQLCPGANYFLKLAYISKNEVIDVYLKKESVFSRKIVCRKFLSTLPKFPRRLRNKSITIKPLEITGRPLTVLLLVNPAQAGRILGLLNYDQYKTVEIYPNQPACLSLFVPIITKRPHINFIDYYDRYYQGTIGRKNIWPEDKMILSLRLEDFKTILNNLEKTPQGSFLPKLSPQKTDDIFD
ncbi:MAG: DUF169 domain-containing protein [bacterium]|nr:DUF169 domain-containing protein [bacterium]